MPINIVPDRKPIIFACCLFWMSGKFKSCLHALAWIQDLKWYDTKRGGTGIPVENAN